MRSVQGNLVYGPNMSAMLSGYVGLSVMCPTPIGEDVGCLILAAIQLLSSSLG